ARIENSPVFIFLFNTTTSIPTQLLLAGDSLQQILLN
ncbi:hypothetical protein Gorai_014405, partial [Gossypium raimondii]|nr:hypothetical protein [Gossypium raimondii]